MFIDPILGDDEPLNIEEIEDPELEPGEFWIGKSSK